MSCLYSLAIKPLLVELFANIFSHSVNCLFLVSSPLQKLASLIRSHLFIFAAYKKKKFCCKQNIYCFISVALGDWPKKTLLCYVRECFAFVLSEPVVLTAFSSKGSSCKSELRRLVLTPCSLHARLCTRSLSAGAALLSGRHGGRCSRHWPIALQSKWLCPLTALSSGSETICSFGQFEGWKNFLIALICISLVTENLIVFSFVYWWFAIFLVGLNVKVIYSRILLAYGNFLAFYKQYTFYRPFVNSIVTFNILCRLLGEKSAETEYIDKYRQLEAQEFYLYFLDHLISGSDKTGIFKYHKICVSCSQH